MMDEMNSSMRDISAEPEPSKLLHSDHTDKIIRCFYSVYNELGFGFLESVYAEAIAIALHDSGIRVEREVKIPVFFRGRSIGDYRADIIVEKCVLVELKTAKSLDASHEAQLFHYLRATAVEVGLLLNFGPKPQFKRIAFSNSRKDPRQSAFKAKM